MIVPSLFLYIEQLVESRTNQSINQSLPLSLSDLSEEMEEMMMRGVGYGYGDGVRSEQSRARSEKQSREICGLKERRGRGEIW